MPPLVPLPAGRSVPAHVHGGCCAAEDTAALLMLGEQPQSASSGAHSPVSSSISAAASTSDGGATPKRPQTSALADAAREPVRSWLRSSASAFLHGSNRAAAERREWAQDADEPAKGNLWHLEEGDVDPWSAAHRWRAAAGAQHEQLQGLAGRSFKCHPVTLTFNDRAVERLYQGHSAAGSSMCPSPAVAWSLQAQSVVEALQRLCYDLQGLPSHAGTTEELIRPQR